jgi:hypothetical protein
MFKNTTSKCSLFLGFILTIGNCQKRERKRGYQGRLCASNTPFYPISLAISKAPKYYHQRMSTRPNGRFFQTAVPVAVLIEGVFFGRRVLVEAPDGKRIGEA